MQEQFTLWRNTFSEGNHLTIMELLEVNKVYLENIFTAEK